MKARMLMASLIAIAASLVLAASASAIGETAQVTINSDSGSTSGCELRDAIAAVVAVSQPATVGGCTSFDSNGLDDQVTFAAGMSGQTITLNGTSPLTINDSESDLGIEGPGMNQLTISGADANRVFNVQTFAFMSGLSVVHGACCTAVAGQGGAIFATARLDLTDVRVADSAASITKTAADAFAAGGGIYTTDRLNLNQSVVTGNSATATNTGTGAGDDAEASGGGIFLNAPDASMTSNESTISDNTADAVTDGDNTSIASATAGIAGDQIELDNSTVSGNVANSSESNGGTANARGALYVHGLGSASHVDDSTIADNTADNTDSGDVLAGGLDLANDTNIRGSTIARNGPESTGDNIDGANILVEGGINELEDTIVAEPRGLGDNCSGTVTSVGFNDDTGASCFTPLDATDLTDTDPLLATGGLAPNGGLTETIALQPTSPVIDQGLAANLSDPTVDQRGFTRPVDFSGLANAAGGDGSDIGAFEVQQACPGFTQPTPSTPCPSAGGGGGTTPTTPLAALGASSAKLKKGSVGIPISCPAGGPACQGSVTLTTGQTLLAASSKTTTIGSASFSIPAGQRQTVKVKLSKRAKKTVQTKGKLTATVKITTQGPGGAKTSTGKLKIKR